MSYNDFPWHVTVSIPTDKEVTQMTHLENFRHFAMNVNKYAKRFVASVCVAFLHAHIMLFHVTKLVYRFVKSESLKNWKSLCLESIIVFHYLQWDCCFFPSCISQDSSEEPN